MFVRGGNVGPGDALYAAGSGGYYWSSVDYSSLYAYYLYFDPYGVYPSYGNYRYFGYSLRCVALGG